MERGSRHARRLEETMTWVPTDFTAITSSFRRRRPGLAMVVSICLSAVVVGCGGIGPRTIAHDRFDYTETLSSSWKQQMLANMVKLRYGDAPVFLDVASVISQYSIETQVDVRLSWMNPQITTGDSQSTGAAARYIDRPTITYMPLSGERFARSLMKPIPPTSILSLIQAGYPIDVVLRTCVHSINGVRNRYGGSGRPRQADPEFYPLLERLRRMQDSGALGLRVEKSGEMEGVVLTFRGKVDPALEEDVTFVRRTLGLALDAKEFQVAYGSIARDDKEIAILSRSILEILVDLASNIEVPSEHVAQQRVMPPVPMEKTAQGTEIPPLIRIHSSSKRPQDSFSSIRYRDHWYFIDDRDMRSKSLFTFLMFIFSLTETQGKEGAPIVTIPAG
jgi:hypothetical protein